MLCSEMPLLRQFFLHAYLDILAQRIADGIPLRMIDIGAFILILANLGCGRVRGTRHAKKNAVALSLGLPCQNRLLIPRNGLGRFRLPWFV